MSQNRSLICADVDARTAKRPAAICVLAVMLAGIAMLCGCGNRCRSGEACARLGLCTSRDGKCVAGADEDCKGSTQCREEGKCTVSGASECVARTDADCRASAVCKASGECKVMDGVCRAANDSDCAASSGCARAGECSYISAPADFDQCWKDEMSLPWNQWPPVDPPGALPGPSREWRPTDPCHAFCAPASNADCQRSEGCRARDLCEVVRGIQGVSWSHCVKTGTAPDPFALPRPALH